MKSDEVPGKRYLGDGVYVRSGSYTGELVLTTENGIVVRNTIVLDANILAALNEYARDVMEAARR